MPESRTDANNNPMAMTVTVAHQAGLVYGTDYEQGESFVSDGATYYTARLLGDPVALTARAIDVIGFYTQVGEQRWVYMAMPHFVWFNLTADEKRDVIGFGYQREGGTAMRHLFPNWGAL
jgi:hypothetical protein